MSTNDQSNFYLDEMMRAESRPAVSRDFEDRGHEFEEKRCGDLIELLEWLLKHRKELNFMATVQFSATFNVTGGGSTLAVSPASQTFNLTVGTPVDGTVAAQVTGGTTPYSGSLDANSGPVPSGVTINVDPTSGAVTLAGTPTSAGSSPSPVLFNIADAAGATAQLKFR
jgi:hypothetical protein